MELVFNFKGILCLIFRSIDALAEAINNFGGGMILVFLPNLQIDFI